MGACVLREQAVHLLSSIIVPLHLFLKPHLTFLEHTHKTSIHIMTAKDTSYFQLDILFPGDVCTDTSVEVELLGDSSHDRRSPPFPTLYHHQMGTSTEIDANSDHEHGNTGVIDRNQNAYPGQLPEARDALMLPSVFAQMQAHSPPLLPVAPFDTTKTFKDFHIQASSEWKEESDYSTKLSMNQTRTPTMSQSTSTARPQSDNKHDSNNLMLHRKGWAARCSTNRQDKDLRERFSRSAVSPVSPTRERDRLQHDYSLPPNEANRLPAPPSLTFEHPSGEQTQEPSPLKRRFARSKTFTGHAYSELADIGGDDKETRPRRKVPKRRWSDMAISATSEDSNDDLWPDTMPFPWISPSACTFKTTKDPSSQKVNDINPRTPWYVSGDQLTSTPSNRKMIMVWYDTDPFTRQGNETKARGKDGSVDKNSQHFEVPVARANSQVGSDDDDDDDDDLSYEA